jgi:hypothetical protein
MLRKFVPYRRAAVVAPVLAFGVLAAVSGSREARAQEEKKCYLMVCDGRVCVAEQMPCPATRPTPIAPSIPG